MAGLHFRFCWLKLCQPLTAVTENATEYRVDLCQVSDTDIEATVNQRRTPDGPLLNPHVFRVVIASQWHLRLWDSWFCMTITYHVV